MSADHEVAVLGVGMHPWGKWGRNFVEYGIVAAQPALADAGRHVGRHRVRRRRRHDPQRLPRLHRRRHLQPGPRLEGQPGGQLLRRLRVGRPGPQHRPGPDPGRLLRRRPRRRRRHHARRASSPRSAATAPTIPTGCASACSAPPTRPTSRSTPAAAWSATAPPSDDFARVRAKNSRHGAANPNARYPKEFTEADVLASPVVADPLTLLEICATSDGAAAIVLTSKEFARTAPTDPVQGRRHLDGHADLPADDPRAARLRHRRRRRAHPARPAVPRRHRPRRLRGGRPRPRRPRPGRGLRPVVGPRARLVREHRPVRRGRGRAAAARRRHRDRRPHPGQPERRAGLLRRGHPGPGHRPGVRAHLAAAGPGHRPPGRGRPGRAHRQPGPVRPRLVGHRHPLTDAHPRNRHRSAIGFRTAIATSSGLARPGSIHARS